METIITLSGSARKVFRTIQLAAEFNGERTLKDLAGPDPLQEEKRAEDLREYQTQREERQHEAN